MPDFWEAGDRALCIDDGLCECCGTRIPGLEKGATYVVRAVTLDYDNNGGEHVFLHIDLPPHRNHQQGWVDAPSFRKLPRLPQRIRVRELVS